MGTARDAGGVQTADLPGNQMGCNCRIARQVEAEGAEMLPHLYQDFAASFDNAFGLGITSSIDNGLAATTGPMTTLLIIYVIVTGWLIMRGDMAARPGIFRIVRAGAS
jgi:hypothetical protein